MTKRLYPDMHHRITFHIPATTHEELRRAVELDCMYSSMAEIFRAALHDWLTRYHDERNRRDALRLSLMERERKLYSPVHNKGRDTY